MDILRGRMGPWSFLFMPKDHSMAALFKRIDTAVMGRKTYDMGLKLGGGKISSPGMKCYVFSRTLNAGERNGVMIVVDSPRQFISTLRKKKGQDIWLMGGGELTREFLLEDLVDGLYLGGGAGIDRRRNSGVSERISTAGICANGE
jgi:dihydrofolate reductase